MDIAAAINKAAAAAQVILMGRTYTQILLHVVFSTKNRQRFLTDDVTERLSQYIGGIIREHGCSLLAMGGVEDHVHMLIQTRTDVALADMMRAVKAKSSRWIKETFADKQDFAWQNGYSAFSVSKSQEPAVRKYVAGQRDHHRTHDFRSEYLKLLQAHEIEIDERFVLD